MNCKPNQLAYVAKLMPWTNDFGDRGHVDIVGKVVKTVKLVQMNDGYPGWTIAEPFDVSLLEMRPRPRAQILTVNGIGDMYLKPLEDGGIDEDQESWEHIHDVMACEMLNGMKAAEKFFDLPARFWNCRCLPVRLTP